MLVKKELLEIPVPDMPKASKTTRGCLRAIAAELPKSGKILACFYWLDEKLQARCFLDGKNYVTLLEQTGTWGKAAPYDRWDSSRRPISTESDNEVVRDFLKPPKWGRNQTADYLLADYIQTWNSERRWKATEAKWARTKRHVQMLPRELPKDLRLWLNEKVLPPQSVILTEKRKDGKARIKCLRCGRIHAVASAPGHRRAYRCPKCGADTVAVLQRYAVCDTAMTKAKIAFCCQTGEATLFIYTETERRLNRDLKYVFSHDPFYFEIKEGGTVRAYKYLHIHGWCDSRYTPFEKVHVYPERMELLWEGTAVAAVRLLDGKAVLLEGLIESLQKRKTTMKLLEHGFISLAPDARYLPESDNFEEVFGISKNYIHACRRWNINHSELQMLQIADCWVDDELFMKIRALQNGDACTLARVVPPLLEKMSFRKMIGYFYRQKMNGRHEIYLMKNWYLDYLRMYEQLTGEEPGGRAAFPKDLKKAHDKLSMQVRMKADAHKNTTIREIYEEKCQWTDFVKGDMMVRMPKGIEDFVLEGTALGHCVGSNSYHSDKHMKQEILVFFLRKQEAPDTPYYTFSVNMKTYRCTECHGKGHKAPTKEIRDFIDAFIKSIQKKEREAA